jgi:hypothetical protein
MSSFQLYLTLGFKHIIDLNGYDHIVFILALCAGYNIIHFKKILILITAFTIGHSITLALSTLKFIVISANTIEFLIPVTILITAVTNIISKNNNKQVYIYFLSLFFGLIHGLGFSNYLKELLGQETSIINSLLAFNIGLELGQIIILTIYFICLYIFIRFVKLKFEICKVFLSGAAAGIAAILIIENKLW